MAKCMEQDAHHDYDVARGDLNKIFVDDSSETVEDLICQGDACMYLHLVGNRIVIGDIFWPLTRIERLDQCPDDPTKAKIEFDTTRTPIKTTILGKDEILGEDFRIFKNISRWLLGYGRCSRQGYLSCCWCQKREDGMVFIERKNDDGSWSKPTQIPIDLRTVKSISIEKYTAKNGKTVAALKVIHDALPHDLPADGKLDIESLRKPAEGAWRPEQVLGMCRIDLKNNALRLATQGRKLRWSDYNKNSMRIKSGAPRPCVEN